jgi:hypothetical protein
MSDATPSQVGERGYIDVGDPKSVAEHRTIFRVLMDPLVSELVHRRPGVSQPCRLRSSGRFGSASIAAERAAVEDSAAGASRAGAARRGAVGI